MYSLLHVLDRNSYEIKPKKRRFPKNVKIIHSSTDLNVLKQLKLNLERGIPKVLVHKCDKGRSTERESHDLRTDILGENFETILEEAVRNEILFISDHGEIQETLNGGCQTEERSPILQSVENVEDQTKLIILRNNFNEDGDNHDPSFDEKEIVEAPQTSSLDNLDNINLPTILIHQDILLGSEEGEIFPNSEAQTENVTQDIRTQRGPQKQHSCLYCHKKMFKISRHYLNVHKDEHEIRDLLLLPKKAPNRMRILNDLRKRGDYLYNTTKTENENNIVCKQGKGKKVCCPHCKGFYSKLSLRNHLRRCDPTKYKNKKSRITIQPECRKLENNIHCKASEDLRTKIFPYLRDDAVVAIIRYDEAVIQYGNYLCRKYTSEHHAAQVRAHLRAFGKLLMTSKELNPNINSMFDLLDARNVPIIIEAINRIAGLDVNTGLFRAPATGTSLCTELKRLCKLLQMEFIKSNDKENLKKMKNLMTVFDMEFQVTINKKGMETQKIIKRRKTTVLPTTAVISQFREYLESKIEFYIRRLENEFCKSNWVKLAEYTLVHLAVFNRKRPGETQRILIEDFKHHEILQENEVENGDVISMEQGKKWARIRFTGKLGNDNALLIHRNLGFRAINLILQYREEAGVDKSNRYIFGEPSTFHKQKTFQACSLIRKLSLESGISNSELLRTRLLRQHLATETASTNVDSKLENRLSDFMSHNKKIHDVHYVLTKKKDDIVKVSTLLENFSSTKKPSLSESVPESTPGTSMQNDNSDSISSDEEDKIFFPYSSDSDIDEDEISPVELNLVLGKQSKRLSWGKEEIALVKRDFKKEIEQQKDIPKKKVNEFFNKNKKIMKNRTPGLIIQWIKGEQNRQQKMKENIKPKKERYSTEEQDALENTVIHHLKEETYPSMADCAYLMEINKVLRSRTPASIKTFIYNNIKKRRSI